MELSAQRIIDLFISAREGGSNYWCGNTIRPNTKATKTEEWYAAMLRGFSIVDHKDSGDVSHVVTRGDIEQALQKFPVECPAQFAAWISEDDDAETGDCFLQLCVFGEVIYG